MRYEELPRELEARFPEFRNAHPRFDHDAAIGTGILVAAFFRFFLDQFRTAQPGDTEQRNDLLDRIFGFLEEAASAEDIEVPNVIQVEFMEHMWKATPKEYGAIKDRLGPASRELLIATEGY